MCSDARRAWTAVLAAFAVEGLIVLYPAVTGSRPALSAAAFVVFAGLMAWATFAVTYVILTVWAFGGAVGDDLWARLTLPTQANRSDRPVRRWLLTGGGGSSWSVQASAAALIVVLVLSLSDLFRTAGWLLVAASVLSVTASWLVVLVSYALEYGRRHVAGAQFDFPGEEQRSFADFVYFSASVTTTFGTTDVLVLTSRMRRTVTGHAFLAFVFNTVIVALLVTSLIG